MENEDFIIELYDMEPYVRLIQAQDELALRNSEIEKLESLIEMKIEKISGMDAKKFLEYKKMKHSNLVDEIAFLTDNI